MDPESSKLHSIDITAKVIKPLLTIPNPRTPQQAVSTSPTQSEYMKLLRIIEQLGRDLKPFYTGNMLRKTEPKVERDLTKACRLVHQCRAALIKNAKKHGNKMNIYLNNNNK